MCYESELRNSTKIKFIPYFSGELAMVTMAGQIAVGGGGDERLEVTGGERTIRRPEAAEQDTRGLRGFEEFSKISPVGLYIKTLSV